MLIYPPYPFQDQSLIQWITDVPCWTLNLPFLQCCFFYTVSLKAILLYYKWKHTAIIYDIDEVFFVRAGSNLVKDFRHDDTMARPYDLPFQRTKVKETSVFLKEASAHARGMTD